MEFQASNNLGNTTGTAALDASDNNVSRFDIKPYLEYGETGKMEQISRIYCNKPTKRKWSRKNINAEAQAPREQKKQNIQNNQNYVVGAQRPVSNRHLQKGTGHISMDVMRMTGLENPKNTSFASRNLPQQRRVSQLRLAMNNTVDQPITYPEEFEEKFTYIQNILRRKYKSSNRSVNKVTTTRENSASTHREARSRKEIVAPIPQIKNLKKPQTDGRAGSSHNLLMPQINEPRTTTTAGGSSSGRVLPKTTTRLAHKFSYEQLEQHNQTLSKHHNIPPQKLHKKQQSHLSQGSGTQQREVKMPPVLVQPKVKLQQSRKMQKPLKANNNTLSASPKPLKKQISLPQFSGAQLKKLPYTVHKQIKNSPKKNTKSPHQKASIQENEIAVHQQEQDDDALAYSSHSLLNNMQHGNNGQYRSSEPEEEIDDQHRLLGIEDLQEEEDDLKTQSIRQDIKININPQSQLIFNNSSGARAHPSQHSDSSLKHEVNILKGASTISIKEENEAPIRKSQVVNLPPSPAKSNRKSHASSLLNTQKRSFDKATLDYLLFNTKPARPKEAPKSLRAPSSLSPRNSDHLAKSTSLSQAKASAFRQNRNSNKVERYQFGDKPRNQSEVKSQHTHNKSELLQAIKTQKSEVSETEQAENKNEEQEDLEEDGLSASDLKSIVQIGTDRDQQEIGSQNEEDRDKQLVTIARRNWKKFAQKIIQSQNTEISNREDSKAQGVCDISPQISITPKQSLLIQSQIKNNESSNTVQALQAQLGLPNDSTKINVEPRAASNKLEQSVGYTADLALTQVIATPHPQILSQTIQPLQGMGYFSMPLKTQIQQYKLDPPDQRAFLLDFFIQQQHFDTGLYLQIKDSQKTNNFIDHSFDLVCPELTTPYTVISARQRYGPALSLFASDRDAKQPIIAGGLHPNHKLVQAVNMLARADFRFVSRLFENCKKPSRIGLYSVWLNWNGQFQPIVVDDCFLFARDPSSKNNPECKLSTVYTSTATREEEIWLMLLEKAIAKKMGGYYHMIVLEIVDYLRMLTGCPVVSSDLKNQKKIINILSETNKHETKVIFVQKATRSLNAPALTQKQMEHSHGIVPDRVVGFQPLTADTVDKARLDYTLQIQSPGGKKTRIKLSQMQKQYSRVHLVDFRPEYYYNQLKIQSNRFTNTDKDSSLCLTLSSGFNGAVFVGIERCLEEQSSYSSSLKCTLSLYRQISDQKDSQQKQVKYQMCGEVTRTGRFFIMFNVSPGTYLLLLETDFLREDTVLWMYSEKSSLKICQQELLDASKKDRLEGKDFNFTRQSGSMLTNNSKQKLKDAAGLDVTKGAISKVSNRSIQRDNNNTSMRSLGVTRLLNKTVFRDEEDLSQNQSDIAVPAQTINTSQLKPKTKKQHKLKKKIKSPPECQ